MKGSCAIIPKVASNDGRSVESRLFRDIYDATGMNRAMAKDIWQKVGHPQFMSDYPGLQTDENGEPTITALRQIGIFPGLDNSKLIRRRETEAGMRDENGPILYDPTPQGIRDAIAKASEWDMGQGKKRQFNAEVYAITEGARTSPAVRLVERSAATDEVAMQTEKENSLANRLIATLEVSYGIGVEVLDDLEEREGAAGITDFGRTERNINGLIDIISIAKGQNGAKALPEEFAHVMIDACADRTMTSRLIHAVRNEDTMHTILGDSYDLYAARYGNDTDRLAREAAGKLLAMHIGAQAEENGRTAAERRTLLRRFSELMRRVWNEIRSFFSGMDPSPLEQILKDTEKTYGDFARKATGGLLDISPEGAVVRDKLYSLSHVEAKARDELKAMMADEEMLAKEIENMRKRMSVSRRRERTSGESTKELKKKKYSSYYYEGIVKELEAKEEAREFLSGTFRFIAEAYNGLQNAFSSLGKIGVEKTKENMTVLRHTRDYIYSYSDILSAVRQNLLNEPEEVKTTDAYKTAITQLDSSIVYINDLRASYTKLSREYFLDFLRPYYAEMGKDPFTGRQSDELEEIISKSLKDINFWDRWMRSCANSSDSVIRLLDSIIQNTHDKARRKTVDDAKTIRALGVRAEKEGFAGNGFRQFFETDQGRITGNYISKYNIGRFKREKNEYYNSLKEQGLDNKQVRIMMHEWYRRNVIRDRHGLPLHPADRFLNSDYESLSVAEKAWLDDFLNLKAEFDGQLPEGEMDRLETVKIRKDFIERLRNSKSAGEAFATLRETAKDLLIERGDDTDINYLITEMDFEGRRIDSVPIYYTSMKKGESFDDLSTDMISTLIAYASMANNYMYTSEIADAMEVGRDILTDSTEGREMGQWLAGRPVGEEVDNVLKSFKQLTKKHGTNFEERLNDMYDMNLYGHYTKNEGTVGKVSVAKAANLLNSVTALNSLALNLTAGVTNVITGNMMMRIEAVAGQFFKMRDVRRADATYALALKETIGEIGKRSKRSKLALFDELFNVKQDFEKDVRDANFARKRFLRIFGLDTLYFLNNCGEHYMQNRTALALAFAYRMKDADGNDTNLWDALEVTDIDPEHPEYGAKLTIREGFTKPDGTAFGDADVDLFTHKSMKINHDMHGIYNYEDRSAFQKMSLGRLALLFRKYIVPSVDRRWHGSYFNYDLDAWQEGFYVTYNKFICNVVKEIRQAGFTIEAYRRIYGNLTDEQKTNIRRARTELVEFAVIMIAIALATPSKDKKRKSRSWLANEAEVLLRREKTEIGAFVPSPTEIAEATKIINSPAASMNTVESISDLLSLLNPAIYFNRNRLKSGRYKDRTRAHKVLMNSVPMSKTLYKAFHPEESIPYYMQQN